MKIDTLNYKFHDTRSSHLQVVPYAQLDLQMIIETISDGVLGNERKAREIATDEMSWQSEDKCWLYASRQPPRIGKSRQKMMEVYVQSRTPEN